MGCYPPIQGCLPDLGIELASRALAGRFFTSEPPGKVISNGKGSRSQHTSHRMAEENVGSGSHVLTWSPVAKFPKKISIQASCWSILGEFATFALIGKILVDAERLGPDRAWSQPDFISDAARDVFKLGSILQADFLCFF